MGRPAFLQPGVYSAIETLCHNLHRDQYFAPNGGKVGIILPESAFMSASSSAF